MNLYRFFYLQDQFDNLDKHTQWGIDFIERYAKFVKERLDIEQNYAKQLRYTHTRTHTHFDKNTNQKYNEYYPSHEVF